MSAAPERAAYWPVPLVRALPVLVMGLAITFTAAHDSQLGLIVFGAFAIATAAVLGWAVTRLDDRVLRGITVTQGVVSAASGIAALALSGGGVGFLIFLLSSFGALTGFLELYLGLRARGRHGFSRDWLTAGVITAIFAVAVLLVPVDLQQPWQAMADGSASGVLTADVVVVGLLGAYGIILGVYLVIGGLSARWSATDAAAPSVQSGVPE